ncbi:MAG TPA: NADH-quinone oxidoreductase subunit N [Bdellovibrionales bacterium]|jgi:NADH-quinone oxidoreductase subunit N|nr:NADH-quinone oxidoreductase subunit N [Bdellovibrionales bacterium]
MTPENPMAWVTLKDLVAVAPMASLFALSMIPLLLKVFMGNREPNPFTVLVYNFIGLMVGAGLTAALFGVTYSTKATAFSNALVVDGISVWMSYLVYFATAVALMLSYDHVATRGKQFTEFCFLTISAAIGMLILIMANDLIVTFIGIETMSLSLYILVAMSKEQVLSKEASFKYFVLGSFASAIFLYGISLMYGTSGTTYFPQLAEALPKLIETNRVFVAGLGLLILGFAFKVSIFPLHAWTPDVYQGAATPVTALMSTAVKAATFVAFLRLFAVEGLSVSTPLYYLLMWLAVLTMTVGNVAAIMQNNFKRVLAYSSVAHSGYALIGLIAAGFGSNYEGAATSLLFYMFSYSIMTLGSFAVVALFEKHANTSLEVNDLRGAARKYPVLGLSLTILMLSLAGIPPTLGFFGKLFIFSAAIEQDMYWLVFWGVINSAISVYYYLRPIVVMYMSEEEGSEVMASHLFTRGAIVVSAIAIVILGILSSPILRIVQKSVLDMI